MKRYALLALGAGLLLGCQKDDILFVKSDSELARLGQAHAPAVQKFTFALSQAQAVRTAGGATLSFPANAFRLPDGRTLATGQAELRVREFYAVPDMLLADMPTTAANSTLLISGGEFSIQVWQGTNRLRLVPTISTIGVPQGLELSSPVPTAGLDTTRMRLWQQPSRTFAAASADSAGWRQTAAAVSTTRTGQYVVTLPLDSIGMWNLDQFWHAYQNNSVVTTEVRVPAGASETRVYFRPVGYNGLARGSSTATGFTARLPLGAAVVAVVLQNRGSQLYYGTQAVTVQANQVLQPTLEELSEAEIIRRIRLL